MNVHHDPLPLSPRMRALLEATQADLAEGLAPFSERFLVEHEVTLDEIHSLSEHVQTAITALLHVPAHFVVTAMAESAYGDIPGSGRMTTGTNAAD